MLGRTRGGCRGLALTLWKASVSEGLNGALSALQGARCFLMCHLLNCWAASLRILSSCLTEVQSSCRFNDNVQRSNRMLQVQWQKAAFLAAPAHSPCPIFHRGVLQSVSVGLPMRWCSRAPFCPHSVCTWCRQRCSVGDSPGEPVFPHYRGAQVCLQWVEMLPEGITVFPSMASCLVFIASMTSAGADAFKNPECFMYWGFMWFVTGRSQSFSSNYFLLIITTIILCLLFYDAT